MLHSTARLPIRYLIDASLPKMFVAAARFGRLATAKTPLLRPRRGVVAVAARQGGRSTSSSSSSGGRGRGRGGGRRPNSGDAASVPRQRRNFDDAQRAALEATIEAATEKARVVVGRGKANMFLDGNPIVYAGAIERIEGEVKSGDYVCVTDHALAPIALGFYNDTSSYSVRILTQAWEPRESAEETIERRIREAYELRAAMGLVGNDSTTCYRLLNSEGDRFSGLNADVYGDVVVASSTAAWVEIWRDVILKSFAKVLGDKTEVVWRRDEKMYEAEGIPWDGELVEYYRAASGESAGDVPGEVRVRENGIEYAVDMAGGHKTGFYVDQRDNRFAVRELSKGKKVLDVCCYTGGFSLNAALGGAESVTAVDSSEAALTVAKRNAELNSVQDKIEFVRADAFDFMQDAIDAGGAGSYDVIVLDPPKFAPNKQALKKALPKYVGLNKRAMTLLRPGGILITCSCSGAVTQERLLTPVVENAARAAGKSATILSIRGASGDQPIDPAYAFGEYLTVLTAVVR